MIEFKTSAERDQYVELSTRNPKLVELLIDLSHHVEDLYNKSITLTSVYRTPAEQAELYKQSVVKVEKSAHETYEAVDLRSRTFSAGEIAEICSYLNSRYKNKNLKPVAMCHAIAGGAFHFHVQLYR